MLTIARRNKEIVRECSERAYRRSLKELILLVVIVEVSLQELVHSEKRGMRRDATARYDLRSLPKPKESLLPIEDGGCLEEAEPLVACL